MGADAGSVLPEHQTAGGAVPAHLDGLVMQLHRHAAVLGGHGADDGTGTGLGRGGRRLGLRGLSGLFPLFGGGDRNHNHHHNDHCTTGDAIERQTAAGRAVRQGIGNVVPVQQRQDLTDGDGIEEVLIQVGPGGVDADDRAVPIRQGAAGVAAAEGGIGLDQLASGAALRQKAADAAGGDGGVALAGGSDGLDCQVCCQRISHCVDLISQRGLRRLPHGKGNALVRGLRQLQKSHILFIVVVHQVGLFLGVFIEEHGELSAA